MILNELIHWKKRPLIYSLILTIGLVILLYILDNTKLEYYIIGVIILSLIFVVEIVSTIYFGNKLLIQYQLPPINNKYHLGNVIQHVFLPIALYISINSFIFFHKYLAFKYLFIIISFYLFWVLFTNIRAYYEDKFVIEIKTHYVYDLISLISYFGLFDTIMNLVVYFEINDIYVVVLTQILILLFYVLVIFRLKIFDVAKIIFPILFVNLGIILLGQTLHIYPIKTAFISTIIYYFFIAYSNHHKENTKSMKVLEEYFVLGCIAIVLLIFN
jgi:hypothetical protein